MSTVRFAVSAEIAAPAGRAYAVLADYRDAHPRILPTRALRNLVVERGGTGAGTVIRYELLLLEDERGTVTTFTVDPVGPARSRVTIATEMESPPLRAAVERLLLPRLLSPVYREEIANLERVASEGLT